MKVYLDANIIYGFFKSLVRSWRERHKHILPDVIKFLTSRKDLSIYVSVLSRCEIARRLKIDYNLSEDDIERMWNYLRRFLKIRMIDKITINEEVVDFIQKNKFRSRINNVIHLFLCKDLHLTFITGDKKIIEDGVKVYKNIMSYAQLRKKYS